MWHGLTTAPRTPRSDLRTILGVQAVRAFVYGFGSILIGSELARAGYSDAEVGLVLTSMLAGFALMSVAVGVTGDRIGRRKLYAGLLLPSAVSATNPPGASSSWSVS